MLESRPVDTNKKRWWIIVGLMLAFLSLAQIGAKDFFTGLFLSVIGYIIVWQTEWFVYNAGRIPFAEKFFRTAGGSRFLYKLIGVLIIVWGFMMATTLDDPIMKWLLKIVFRRGL